MILLQNERVGCENCIRGHRAADCEHLHKYLISIKGRGRPAAKDESIRLRLEPNPVVIFKSMEPIESKNGRGKSTTTKRCFNLDPNTPVSLVKVKLGRGFKVIGPVEDYNYQVTFRVNSNQNLNLVLPPDLSMNGSTSRKSSDLSPSSTISTDHASFSSHVKDVQLKGVRFDKASGRFVSSNLSRQKSVGSGSHGSSCSGSNGGSTINVKTEGNEFAQIPDTPPNSSTSLKEYNRNSSIETTSSFQMFRKSVSSESSNDSGTLDVLKEPKMENNFEFGEFNSLSQAMNGYPHVDGRLPFEHSLNDTLQNYLGSFSKDVLTPSAPIDSHDVDPHQSHSFQHPANDYNPSRHEIYPDDSSSNSKLHSNPNSSSNLTSQLHFIPSSSDELSPKSSLNLPFNDHTQLLRNHMNGFEPSQEAMSLDQKMAMEDHDVNTNEFLQNYTNLELQYHEMENAAAQSHKE